MSDYYYFKPGSEKDCSSFSTLEEVLEDKEYLEFIIKTMEKSFNYKLNVEQKALVVKSIYKVAESTQKLTMLDCFEEWNKYPILDYWNAYVQKYFLF